MSCLSQLPGYAASYKDDYDYCVGNVTDCSRVSHLAGSLIMIAVLVIGALAAAHVFPHSATGWTTVGLGGGYMACKLLGKGWNERRADLITSALVAALLVTFGALGVTNILTPAEVGYAMLGTCGLATCMTVGMMMGAKRLCPRPPVPQE